MSDQQKETRRIPEVNYVYRNEEYKKFVQEIVDMVLERCIEEKFSYQIVLNICDAIRDVAVRLPLTYRQGQD